MSTARRILVIPPPPIQASPLVFTARFLLPGYPPVQLVTTAAPHELAARRPGPWLAHHILPDHQWTWRLINLTNGDAVWPG